MRKKEKVEKWILQQHKRKAVVFAADHRFGIYLLREKNQFKKAVTAMMTPITMRMHSMPMPI